MSEPPPQVSKFYTHRGQVSTGLCVTPLIIGKLDGGVMYTCCKTCVRLSDVSKKPARVVVPSHSRGHRRETAVSASQRHDIPPARWRSPTAVESRRRPPRQPPLPHRFTRTLNFATKPIFSGLAAWHRAIKNSAARRRSNGLGGGVSAILELLGGERNQGRTFCRKKIKTRHHPVPSQHGFVATPFGADSRDRKTITANQPIN